MRRDRAADDCESLLHVLSLSEVVGQLLEGPAPALLHAVAALVEGLALGLARADGPVASSR